jgi:hypothetical protein
MKNLAMTAQATPADKVENKINKLLSLAAGVLSNSILLGKDEARSRIGDGGFDQFYGDCQE